MVLRCARFARGSSAIKRKNCVTSRISCNGENGKKGKETPEGWRLNLDGKIGSLESGDFRENGKFSRNGKKLPGRLESGDFSENGKFGKMASLAQLAKNRHKGWQYPECGKYSNGMPKVHGSCVSGNVSRNRVIPWRVHLLTTY